MTRISNPMDWADLEQLASDIRAELVYRRARCQHGKTRQQTCIDCEGGYADDHATYAAGIGNVAKWNGEPCWAVSDDGEDVAYLPARYQARIYREEPIEQLKQLAQPGNTEPMERTIQRILSRLYHFRRSEMMLSAGIQHIGVPAPDSVDSAAWRDIAEKTPAQASPSVRFPGDGSAWTTHYGPDGMPFHRRFVRVGPGEVASDKSCCKVARRMGGHKCPVCSAELGQANA